MSGLLLELRRGHAAAISFAAYAAGALSAANGAAWLSALACAAAAAIAFAGGFGRQRRVAAAAPELCAIVAASMAIGTVAAMLALQREARPPYASLNDRHLVVMVTALERPRPDSSGASLRVRIDEVVTPRSAAAASLAGAGALLTLPAGADDRSALAGSLLRARVRLAIPGGPRNEGERPERDILADQGVSVILAVARPGAVRRAGAARGWAAWWARARSRLAGAAESRLPPVEATVLEGILWGDRGNLPAVLRQEFSDTGTVHVLTTAGLHLGIMAAFVAGLMSLVPAPRPTRVAVTLCAAWAYAALAGMHLPTVRAATMLTAGAIAHELGRGRTPSAVLSAAAFAVALPHPLALLSPSFAMSFACVGGIALLSPALAAAGLEGRGVWRPAVEVARTSTAVQIALWPLQALYFNAFTPHAILANVFVVPLVGAVMAAGSALVAAAVWLPFAAAPLANLTWWGVVLLTTIVRRFASLPFAHIDVPPPSRAFLILYWIALGGFAWAAGRRPALLRDVGLVTSACAALALAYGAPGIAAALDREVRLDAIDVGQADCLLLRAPGMHALLVDGGGKLERAGAGNAIVAQPIGDRIAARTVMPFLLRHWVLRLDAVVLTHPHGDHAGGLPLILERERVGALYDSAQLYGGPAYHRALDVVRERRIPWLRAQRGVTFDLGPATHVEVLAPELPLIAGSASDINNNSVVLRVTHGRVAMLLTGDAQSEAEARLLSHGGAGLRAAILKVGHHGSAYSSTPAFLAAVQPRIAIISCGLHNVFGHPSPRTLAALRAVGAQVFRTDLDGGVTVVIDGARVHASSAVSAAAPRAAAP